MTGPAPLPHGYTNRTVHDAGRVVKAYTGTDAAARQKTEYAALTGVADRLPVPPVLAAEDGRLTLGFVEGAHGQDLLDAGDPEAVLHGCGAVLARLHALPPAAAGVPGTRGQVLVHGDFGPQNTLLDPRTYEVTAVLDWEWTHAGEAIEDLAWCEWIVRMHHPDRVAALGALFAGYGAAPPPWRVRHAAMLTRCDELAAFCARSDPGGAGERSWHARRERTAGWRP